MFVSKMARRMAVNFTKLCGLILVGTLVYNEYISYYLSQLSWPHLPSDQDLTVVLLVADSQIQGVKHEPEGVVGSIQRWDSDRFLHKSYKWAVGAYSINSVVFLGDLIDEGSETEDEMYGSYASRFHSIYPAWGHQMIYIPGDNDIGGEGVDPVTLRKIDRFEEHFGPSSSVYSISGQVDIVPVSRLTEHGSYNLTQKPSLLTTTKVVLAISHVPVLPLNGRFAEKVMNLVNPDLILSAHDHAGYLFTADRQSRKLSGAVQRFSKKDKTPLELQTRVTADPEMGIGTLTEMVSEVVVPTCSYRMGVSEMGLGLLAVNSQGEVIYSNLWLPSRFSLLYTYAASLVVVVILFLMGKMVEIKRLFRRRQEIQGKLRKNYEPLLRL